MDSQKLNPVDRIAKLVLDGENFILQGGAGSGKTESLKRVVQKVLSVDQKLKIACITHTNKAADEMAERISADIKVSTIHSFLGGIISPYKRNIQYVFPTLFELSFFIGLGDEHYGGDEKLRKSEEHGRYKKAYEKLEIRRQTVLGELTPKVTGKRDYDKAPEACIAQMNQLIGELNQEIRAKLSSRKADEFFYNETKFDNFNEPSFGHDGLIAIACKMFDEFPVLGKIVSDRYDCIFIDEYQDTNADVIRVLLRCLPKPSRTIIGLFGDSEQAIYSDGIGNAREHIDAKEVVLVEKDDNYRCSQQVITFANQFRTDGLKQEVALKTLDDGTIETPESREGGVTLLYDFAPDKVDTGDRLQDRKTNSALVREALDDLVGRVSQDFPGYVQLKLTNKSIANDVGFGQLYQIFDDRYSEPRDRMRKTLDRLQFDEIVSLTRLHQSLPGDRRSYNRLITALRKRGFSISSVSDKTKLDEMLRAFTARDLSVHKALEFAAKVGLIRISESHAAFLMLRDKLLVRLKGDPVFEAFEALHSSGYRTKPQMLKEINTTPKENLDSDLIETEYDDRVNELKQKTFFTALFSDELRFDEVLSFYDYEENDGGFATMHKTKGTGIENVLLVIDEYGWTTEYDFVNCFMDEAPSTKRDIASRKLLYVAASRTKKNLVCVRLMNDQAEMDRISPYFPDAIQVKSGLS
ncbi:MULTISPECIES: UvrD-helicase domain-containing protein [unclassified Gluconobacter]|uniref:UvrD-helicase domain-containing protein n=1 Tax=unclassified Gluconobacter TaxID=2644261 RepID=UPI00029B376B|nr:MULTISPECIES: ATP-dependent helicase [unclassified Gluconobacter]GAP25493.1 ATP-dependent DNA helicase protein [Gluconobacter frateurii NBRC 101659]